MNELMDEWHQMLGSNCEKKRAAEQAENVEEMDYCCY